MTCTYQENSTLTFYQILPCNVTYPIVLSCSVIHLCKTVHHYKFLKLDRMLLELHFHSCTKVKGNVFHVGLIGKKTQICFCFFIFIIYILIQAISGGGVLALVMLFTVTILAKAVHITNRAVIIVMGSAW